METERTTNGDAGTLAIAIHNAVLANSDPIDMRVYAGGALEIPASMASTSLTWYCARARNGTYVPAYFDGAAVTSALPGSTACSINIPEELWARHWIKALANSDAATVYVSKKS